MAKSCLKQNSANFHYRIPNFLDFPKWLTIVNFAKPKFCKSDFHINTNTNTDLNTSY